MPYPMNTWRSAMASPGSLPLPLLFFPGMDLAGVRMRDVVARADLQTDVMQAINETWKSAAAVSIMDLSLESEAFGASVSFSDTDVPSVTGTLVETEDDVKHLAVPEVGSARTGVLIEAVTRAAAVIRDRPVFAGAAGPFSLAGNLMNVTEIMVASITEPELVRRLLEKTTRFLIDYVLAFRDAGADGVILSEPAAGLLSAASCLEFSSRYVREIITAVETDQFRVIYHNCGNVSHLSEAILATGASMLHFGNAVDLQVELPKYPSHVLIMGNVDPAGEFRNGTPESMHTAVTGLKDALGHAGNWVLSSGCDIPPGTPKHQTDAFFAAAAGQLNTRGC